MARLKTVEDIIRAFEVGLLDRDEAREALEVASTTATTEGVASEELCSKCGLPYESGCC